MLEVMDLTYALDEYEEAEAEPFVGRFKMPAHDLIAYVCKLFKTTVPEFMGGGRNRQLVGARSVVSVILREDRGLSYPVIGRICGGRDHTTIQHQCKTFRRKWTICPDWELAYNMAREAFLR